MENPKDTTKKVLEVINNVVRSKTEISVVFLYPNNEVAERQIKKTVPFTLKPKRIRYIGISGTKEFKTCTQQ